MKVKVSLKPFLRKDTEEIQFLAFKLIINYLCYSNFIYELVDKIRCGLAQLVARKAAAPSLNLGFLLQCSGGHAIYLSGQR